jgi:hypothetical protein
MLINYPYLERRFNKSHFWCPCDTKENYKEEHNGEKNLYKPGDFMYTYNSLGFRCDDFNSPSDINILFLGCSFTEGIGLPAEETWAYKLLSIIRKETNKNIAYWNLALGGTGIDTQANLLYWFSKTKKIDYVFSLVPDLNRREYYFGENVTQYWCTRSSDNKSVDEVLLDNSYTLYQNLRSLMLIESIISDNIKMYCSTWCFTSLKEILKREEFKSLNYFPSVSTGKPLARDGMHPGPAYHTSLSLLFWQRIKHHFVDEPPFTGFNLPRS